MSLDNNMFNFASIVEKLGKNPFSEEPKWAGDNRFYTLPKDENGNGAAVVALMLDPDMQPIKRAFRINCSNTVNGKVRFCNEWSPATISMPDPFQEEWQRLTNAGKTEEAKKFSRATRHVTNILVVQDPKRPENNGKVFLYDMSKVILSKIVQAVNPSDEDIATGAKCKEVFDPTSGWVLRLVARTPENAKMPDYGSSEFIKLDKPVFEDNESAKKFIMEHCYKLSMFQDPSFYKSYDELKQMFDRVTNSGGVSNVAHSTTSELVDASAVSNTQSKSDNSAADELSQLLNTLK